MQTNGYVLLPVNTYLAWETTTNGNGYDADGYYGDQCWDLVAEFWYNNGFGTGYPTLAGTGGARGMWADRVQNAGDKFDLIYNLADVKQGDVLVYDQFPGNEWGHTGFANEDYNTWSAAHPGDYEFPILSQNNQGIPYVGGGTFTNIHGYDTRLFLGAFRLKAWNPTPPPVPTTTKKKFPWVLYARKLRERNMV